MFAAPQASTTTSALALSVDPAWSKRTSVTVAFCKTTHRARSSFEFAVRWWSSSGFGISLPTFSSSRTAQIARNHVASSRFHAFASLARARNRSVTDATDTSQTSTL